MQNKKRNYYNMIGNVKNGFIEVGWKDGYEGIDSQEEDIICELYNKIELMSLYECINSYLKGYYIGKNMKDNHIKKTDKKNYISNEDDIPDYSKLVRDKLKTLSLNGRVY